MALTRRASARAALALLAVVCLAGVPAGAQTTTSRTAASDDARLTQLLADTARRELALDPISAMYRGENVDPAILARVFDDDFDRQRQLAASNALQALKAVDRARLSPERRISYDVFAATQRRELEWHRPDIRMLTAVRPLNHLHGLHVEFPSLIDVDGPHGYASEADYRHTLTLAHAFPVALDGAIAQLRKGLRTGILDARPTVARMIEQIDGILAVDPAASQFTAAVRAFPETVPEAARQGLRDDFAAVTRDGIYPAYRRLRAFLADEYLPAARAAVGLSAMKGGAALYRLLIERETTMKLDPEQVHRLGRDEVARIKREMEAVKTRLGFAGPLPAFFEHVRTEPRFHPTSREQLAEGFAAVGRVVAAQIPRFFARTPAAPLGIEPYPAYREASEPGGGYSQGSADGKRPGVFYYNAFDLPSRFLTGIATLYLHEGSPGHHFQLSRAQEDGSLPDFQRFDGNNAYVEGWALYAETLGYEMGLYDDPMQHWGTLDDEMLRAMRLVVDTGLHAKGWSREQAIAYMLANSGIGRTDAAAEVDRYIANPAQALSYKIGAMTIQRLRREAETALGEAFDIRDFHEQVLGSGALPLPVLETKVRGWIAASR
jgi:uncharacterized protein (DUF885 family)